MAQEESVYLFGDPSEEVERLTMQHTFIKHGMNKLILAPLDLSQPDLHILDSATADGLWLRDISTSLTPPYTLIGADRMNPFFPKIIPPHLSLLTHDFTEPWPTHLHAQCDLVHQRFALGGARSASAENSVKLLTTLLKPGGWIQLGENDLSHKPEDGSGTRAFHRALKAVIEAGGSGSAQNMPGTMARWLREAGLVDVEEVVVNIPVGRKCEDEGMVRLSTESCIMTAKAVAEGVKALGGDMGDEELRVMEEDYARELKGEGTWWYIIIATGRKPMK